MSGILGFCGICWYSNSYAGMHWGEDGTLYCQRYKEGVPPEVMHSLRTRGYCPEKDRMFKLVKPEDF